MWEYPPKKRSGYLVMRRGNNILGFYCGNKEVYEHSFFSRFPRNTLRSYGVEIGIYVCDKDIATFYEETVRKIGKRFIVKPLSMKPWGKRDFRIVGQFGFYLRFSEPLNILKKPVKRM